MLGLCFANLSRLAFGQTEIGQQNWDYMFCLLYSAETCLFWWLRRQAKIFWPAHPGSLSHVRQYSSVSYKIRWGSRVGAVSGERLSSTGLGVIKEINHHACCSNTARTFYSGDKCFFRNLIICHFNCFLRLWGILSRRDSRKTSFRKASRDGQTIHLLRTWYLHANITFRSNRCFYLCLFMCLFMQNRQWNWSWLEHLIVGLRQFAIYF